MLPLTVGLIQGGMSLLGNVTGLFGQQSQADARNKAIADQYRQQLVMRDIRTRQSYNQYNLKKLGYEQKMSALQEQTAMQYQQEQLRMNELLKGAKVASQSDLVNQATALGRIDARGQSGVSAQRARTMSVAAMGRSQALRTNKLLGEQDAMMLRNEARRQTLKAGMQKAYNEVAFVPTPGPAPLAPTFVEGPSTFDMLAGIGGAALTGFNAYQGQNNFRKDLLSKPPGIE